MPLYSMSTHQGVSVDRYCLGGSRYGMGIISLHVQDPVELSPRPELLRLVTVLPEH